MHLVIPILYKSVYIIHTVCILQTFGTGLACIAAKTGEFGDLGQTHDILKNDVQATFR